MITLTASLSCDGWLYTQPNGEKIPRCQNHLEGVVVSLREPRTSLFRNVRERGWWRDPADKSRDPNIVCPDCRALMRKK